MTCTYGNMELRGNWATGSDGIHWELIKYGQNKLLDRIYGLIRKILDEERMPKEWKETIIVSTHRIEDWDMCENRGEWHYEMKLTEFCGI
jgi:hypothetical protein